MAGLEGGIGSLCQCLRKREMLSVSLETNPHILLLALISRLMMQYMFLFNCWKKKAVLCSDCAGVVTTSEFSEKKIVKLVRYYFSNSCFHCFG